MDKDRTAVDAVALKLPPLWTEDVESWFAQVESQFALRKITCEVTQFHYVVTSLNSSVSSRVKRILRCPPEAPYSALKEALTAKFSPTPFERATAIMEIHSLGGQKPSEMMDRLLNLLGAHDPDLLFNHHFVSILPDYVRNVLASSIETDPEKLAAEADRIFISGKPGPSISNVIDDDDDHAAVFATGRNNAQGFKSSGGPRRSFQRKPAPSASGHLCFYHSRFGARATKCEPNCSWSGNLPVGRQQ